MMPVGGDDKEESIRVSKRIKQCDVSFTSRLDFLTLSQGRLNIPH